jgi:hypothetical protein
MLMTRQMTAARTSSVRWGTLKRGWAAASQRGRSASRAMARLGCPGLRSVPAVPRVLPVGRRL